MATTPGRIRCIACGKEKVTSKCSGCLQDFCYNHLGEHRQQLSKQLDEIQGERDLFHQTITQQTMSSQKHPLLKEIDQWEQQSIQKIQQTAEEARQLLVKYTSEHIIRIGQRLNKLTEQLKHSRDEDDIMETDLHKWKEELQQMTEQLNKSPNIEIQQSSTCLINKIQVEFFGK
jgi:chromosome segregation ATPase